TKVLGIRTVRNLRGSLWAHSVGFEPAHFSDRSNSSPNRNAGPLDWSIPRRVATADAGVPADGARAADGKGPGRPGHGPGRLWPWPGRPGVRGTCGERRGGVRGTCGRRAEDAGRHSGNARGTSRGREARNRDARNPTFPHGFPMRWVDFVPIGAKNHPAPPQGPRPGAVPPEGVTSRAFRTLGRPGAGSANPGALSRRGTIHPGLDLDRLQLVGGVEAEDAAVEVELGFEAADLGLRLAEAVLLALEGEVGVGDAVGGHRGDHRLRLVRRHNRILESLEEDHRGAQAPGEVDRRALAVEVGALRIRADQPVEVAGLELVRVAGEGLGVGDAVIAGPGGGIV